MGDTFHTRPDAVRSLAQEFRAAAEELKAASHSFSWKASDVGSAFGLLGACTSTTNKYHTLVSETLDGLLDLSEALAGDSDGLQHNADGYHQTDQHNSGLFGGG